MQTSMVFSQRRWPGIGSDLDDCWAVSAIQAANVTSPWLRLVGVTQFRAEAGNPDDPGPDGGTIGQIAKGLRGCYPVLVGHLHVMRGESWTNFVRLAEAGHPITVAVDSSKLPVPLRFGFLGRHQVTLAYRGGKVLYANPLAQPYARWLHVEWDDVRPAIMAFGVIMTGTRGAWAVALPTDAEAYDLYRDWTDPTPFGQDDIDAATSALQARIDAARQALEGG